MMTSSGSTACNVHLNDLEQVHGPLFYLWKKTESEGAWSTKRTAMVRTILFTSDTTVLKNWELKSYCRFTELQSFRQIGSNENALV